MSGENASLASRAEDLREAFDGSFAQSPAAPDGDHESLLAVRAGGEACAVPLAQTRGLYADRKLVALPGRLPAFLGITCLRSGIVAAYSLPIVLGHPPAVAPPRWLLLTCGAQPFALAFEHFDGYARLRRDEISPTPGLERGGHVQGSALIAGERRSILSLHAIAQSLSPNSRS